MVGLLGICGISQCFVSGLVSSEYRSIVAGLVSGIACLRLQIWMICVMKNTVYCNWLGVRAVAAFNMEA